MDPFKARPPPRHIICTCESHTCKCHLEIKRNPISIRQLDSNISISSTTGGITCGRCGGKGHHSHRCQRIHSTSSPKESHIRTKNNQSLKSFVDLFNSWKYITFPYKLKNKILYNNNIFIKYINPIPEDFHGHGKIYLSNHKLLYKGDIHHGLYNGQGTLYISENNTYIGQFKDGTFNGYGEFHTSKNPIYHGHWKHGYRNGTGKEYHNNTLVYKGMWKYDQKNGMGKEYVHDIVVYEGLWKHNQKNGYGKEFDNHGVKLKEGLWKHNTYIQDIHEDLVCIICFKEKRSIAFIPCGHLCMCSSCSHKYNDTNCIVCRKTYDSINKIFI
jgi:hypothetical protein